MKISRRGLLGGIVGALVPKPPEHMYYDPQEVYNYTQIFRKTLTITNTRRQMQGLPDQLNDTYHLWFPL